jgi:hypothetical protein
MAPSLPDLLSAIPSLHIKKIFSPQPQNSQLLQIFAKENLKQKTVTIIV